MVNKYVYTILQQSLTKYYLTTYVLRHFKYTCQHEFGNQYQFTRETNSSNTQRVLKTQKYMLYKSVNNGFELCHLNRRKYTITQQHFNNTFNYTRK